MIIFLWPGQTPGDAPSKRIQGPLDTPPLDAEQTILPIYRSTPILLGPGETPGGKPGVTRLGIRQGPLRTPARQAEFTVLPVPPGSPYILLGPGQMPGDAPSKRIQGPLDTPPLDAEQTVLPLYRSTYVLLGPGQKPGSQPGYARQGPRNAPVISAEFTIPAVPPGSTYIILGPGATPGRAPSLESPPQALVQQADVPVPNVYALSVAGGAYNTSGAISALANGISSGYASFTLTGEAASLSVVRLFANAYITLGPGETPGKAPLFALQGPPSSTVQPGYRAANIVSVGYGAFSLTGVAQALALALPAGYGAFSETGEAATPAVGIGAGYGAIAETGEDSTLAYTPHGGTAYTLATLYGGFSLTGVAQALGVGIISDSGAVALTGEDSTIAYTPSGNFALAGGFGPFTLTGESAALAYVPVVVPAPAPVVQIPVSPVVSDIYSRMMPGAIIVDPSGAVY